MKKTKFSAIDILIVIFLIIVIVFGFIKIKGSISGTTKEKIRFSVMATGVEEGTKDIIAIGEEVSISVKEKAYATVVAASETPHSEQVFSDNLGKYVKDEVEGEADLLLELECIADTSDTEILCHNVPIRVGEESYIHGKGYSLHGYIVTVDEIDE